MQPGSFQQDGMSSSKVALYLRSCQDDYDHDDDEEDDDDENYDLLFIIISIIISIITNVILIATTDYYSHLKHQAQVREDSGQETLFRARDLALPAWKVTKAPRHKRNVQNSEGALQNLRFLTVSLSKFTMQLFPPPWTQLGHCHSFAWQTAPCRPARASDLVSARNLDPLRCKRRVYTSMLKYLKPHNRKLSVG